VPATSALTNLADLALRQQHDIEGDLAGRGDHTAERGGDSNNPLPVGVPRHDRRGEPEHLGHPVDDAGPRRAQHAEIEAAVEDANKAVSRAESIRKFTILPEEWTEDGGQLTPSLKLRRSVVLRDHVDDVEALYSH
jgi:long-subunit acyl-CoA synthetase (AMP-forming)